jgi:hypothetical protein
MEYNDLSFKQELRVDDYKRDLKDYKQEGEHAKSHKFDKFFYLGMAATTAAGFTIVMATVSLGPAIIPIGIGGVMFTLAGIGMGTLGSAMEDENKKNQENSYNKLESAYSEMTKEEKAYVVSPTELLNSEQPKIEIHKPGSLISSLREKFHHADSVAPTIKAKI